MSSDLFDLLDADSDQLDDSDDEVMQLRIKQAHDYWGVHDLTKGFDGDGYEDDDRWTLSRIEIYVKSLGKLLDGSTAGTDRVQLTPQNTLLLCSMEHFKVYDMDAIPREPWPEEVPKSIDRREWPTALPVCGRPNRRVTDKPT